MGFVLCKHCQWLNNGVWIIGALSWQEIGSLSEVGGCLQMAGLDCIYNCNTQAEIALFKGELSYLSLIHFYVLI